MLRAAWALAAWWNVMELKHVIRALIWLALISLCILLFTSGAGCETVREMYRYITAPY